MRTVIHSTRRLTFHQFVRFGFWVGNDLKQEIIKAKSDLLRSRTRQITRIQDVEIPRVSLVVRSLDDHKSRCKRFIPSSHVHDLTISVRRGRLISHAATTVMIVLLLWSAVVSCGQHWSHWLLTFDHCNVHNEIIL